MQDFIEKITEQFRNFFLELDPVRKLWLIAITVIVITILVAIVTWASKTSYKTLFTNMNTEDSSLVARLLEEKSIAYLLEDNGKTIKIPEDQVEILRIEMAKQGVALTGTVGYEVFDDQEFGTTSFVQRVNKQRALEGELVKTINYLKGVKRSRVHLSIPENSPFASQIRPPAGSVVLELLSGVVLTEGEIRGIASLVASTVEGMRVENVTILDSRGKKLSENIGDQMTADTGNRLSLESKLNSKLESQVEEILSKVIGEGKVEAKVHVKMDFTQKVETETRFDQENAAVLSEVTNSQKMQGVRPSPQGLPGARSNLPGESPQPGIPETKNNVDKSIQTKNYNVPSTVTKSRSPTAKVKSISVAVMLDGKHVPVLDANGNTQLDKNDKLITKYEQWSEGEVESFREIVSSTLGLDVARGDKIVIRNMKFVKEDLSEADAILKRQAKRAIIKNIVKYIAVGLVMSMFFVVVVRPFIQWVTENTVESVEDFLPKTIEELEKIQSDQKLPGLEDALPQIEEKLNPEKIEGNMLKEKINGLIADNPSKAAQLIHGWIHQVDSEKQIA